MKTRVKVFMILFIVYHKNLDLVFGQISIF